MSPENTGATPPIPYAGNAEPVAIAERLRAAKRVLITTHAKPDGDAVGSTLAVARACRAGGAHAEIWLTGPVDFSLRRFLGSETIGDPARSPPQSDPDVIVVVDTGSWSQLDRMADWVRARPDRTVLIDHHRSGDPAMAAMRLIDIACASTTQLLVRVMDAMGVPLDSVAEPLFLGLATDTGWFRFSNADAAVFECAARLLRAGVDKDRLYRQIEETARPGRLQLLARGLTSLEFHADGRAALMVLTPEDFKASGGGAEDLAGVVNTPMSIGTVEMSVLVTESEPGVVKLSFRSKPPLTRGAPFVDVNAFAAKYGGGGHIHAAGAKMKCTIPEALERLRRDLNAI